MPKSSKVNKKDANRTPPTPEKFQNNIEIDVGGDANESNFIVGNNNQIIINKTDEMRNDGRQTKAFVLAILVVTGIALAVLWASMQPQKMSGDFNVAIAKFGEIQSDGTIKPSAQAESIRLAIFNFLDSEFKTSNLNTEVSYKNMPLILEDLQAEELAQKINADIIIYGTISIIGDHAEFSPRFYVSEGLEVNEMTGQNKLALPITFLLSDITGSRLVKDEMRARTAVLVDFTKALIFLSQKDFESARRAIQNAIVVAERNPSFKGQEVLYLTSAIIFKEKQDFEKANQALDKAFLINPDYSRAFLTKGNIYYIQALKDNFNPFYLNNARYQFEQAFEAADQPDYAYIPEKAKTGLGNVYVILAQQTNDPVLFQEAIENYKYIIDRYETTQNPALQINTSIAYFGLGACYERMGEIEKAITMYQRAYELTKDIDTEAKERIKAKIASLEGEK